MSKVGLQTLGKTKTSSRTLTFSLSLQKPTQSMHSLCKKKIIHKYVMYRKGAELRQENRKEEYTQRRRHKSQEKTEMFHKEE